MENHPKSAAHVRKHLAAILASDAFRTSPRAQNFLQLVVERSLADHPEELRERMIGAELYGRDINYDTSNDGIVRVEASKVRKRLAQFYRELSAPSDLVIELPLGSYVAVFHWQEEKPAAAAPPAAVPNPVVPAPVAPASDVPIAVVSGPLPRRRPLARAIRVVLARKPVLVALSASILFAAGLSIGLKWHNASIGHHAIHTIAVLPLSEYSSNSEPQFEADSITTELISDLGEIPALHVISRTSSATFRGSHETLPEIARHLNADAIVEGSVVITGHQVHITADLIDARTDQPLWSRKYVREIDSNFGVEGEIAQSIADEVKIALTPEERAHLLRTRTEVPLARQLLTQARQAEDRFDPSAALEFTRKAIDADQNFAEAYAEQAMIYLWLAESATLPYHEAALKAEASARRALALDDHLAEAHLAIAALAMGDTWDWSLMQQELARAQQLNPSQTEVLWSSVFSSARFGYFDRAISTMQEALRLDPVTFRSIQNAAYVYYFARRYDDALHAIQQGEAMQHEPNATAMLMGSILTEKGQYAAAVQQFRMIGDNPHVLGHLGNTYARMGNGPAARQLIAQLQKHVAEHQIGNYEIALIYAGLGERDQAFAWLDKAFAVRDKGVTYLKIDPCMDNLRSDPRLAQLIRRIGLP